ncbi:MAG: lipid-A-disaccharide synthase [Acidobacteria bacterium]|nr:lipid-A-disaccharide synthase [Acidobacteriota bacterium]MBI3473385.1 lipid-A-disaccharide synthase [Candidatus Solibacter usitatus]
MPLKILISAGEASGDLYASLLVKRLPDEEFFGCTGPRMRALGVRTVIDAASLAVVGLVEVLEHLPRIYREYRKLAAAAVQERPDLAILTDSPDFHLRLARRLKAQGVPIVYLVAPQVWAWRRGRLPDMRRLIDHLLCIFPFEEEFFRRHGVAATYIGHPLAGLAKPLLTRQEFFKKHRLPPERPLVTVLPGSRRGEAARHLAALLEAVDRLYQDQAASFLLPASATAGAGFFRERIGRAPIQVIEGETWDAIAHADLALAASGTVTVEAALLGTPMVTFYRVTGLSWLLGKMLVRTPFYCMVNLVAGRKVVPELMQSQMTGERLAAEARKLLRDPEERRRMKAGLAEVAAKLSSDGDPMDRAAAVIDNIRRDVGNHVGSSR